MIPITDKMRDILMVVAALCWAFVIYASWVGGPATRTINSFISAS